MSQEKQSEDRRYFVPCPKCWTKNYEWDTLTADDEQGRWLFNFKCSNCGFIYNSLTTMGSKQGNMEAFKGSDSAMGLAKMLLHPKALAKMTKAVQGEIDKGKMDI